MTSAIHSPKRRTIPIGMPKAKAKAKARAKASPKAKAADRKGPAIYGDSTIWRSNGALFNQDVPHHQLH